MKADIICGLMRSVWLMIEILNESPTNE